MGASGYFNLALLVLVLLPVVILPWEGRRTPDWLYAIIALCGTGLAAWQNGAAGVAWALGAGIGCLIVIGLGITALRSRTRLRILTGGQIKLLAAGATWLGVYGAAVMMVIAFLILLVMAAFRNAGALRGRPDASTIVAVAIISVAMQQHLPGMW